MHSFQVCIPKFKAWEAAADGRVHLRIDENSALHSSSSPKDHPVFINIHCPKCITVRRGLDDPFHSDMVYTVRVLVIPPTVVMASKVTHHASM